jgi:hypothetical protein
MKEDFELYDYFSFERSVGRLSFVLSQTQRKRTNRNGKWRRARFAAISLAGVPLLTHLFCQLCCLDPMERVFDGKSNGNHRESILT